jgi:hypothetical protein
MTAPMSIDTFETTPCVVAQPESLAERMARSPLSLVEALRYATEISSALRDLHRHGLAYGAVSSQWILLGPSHAALRATGGLKHLDDPRRDVAAYGAVLEEMLRREDLADAGLDDLREKARALALGCRNGSRDMRHVLIVLRLLGIEARQREGAAVPLLRPTLVQRIPVAAVPVKAPRVRARIRLTLHWKPLANLAIFALSGK